MADLQKDLSFTELALGDLDYVYIETTSCGPFGEDLFYEVVAGSRWWRVASSRFPIDWLTALPNVNNEAVIEAQFSTGNAYFLAWAREPDLVITSKTRTQLAKRFETLISKLFVIQEVEVAGIVESVISEYESTTRHYHGLRHIAQCLKELDSMDGELFNRDAIEMAIWYHDIVYIAGSRENEGKSAQRLMSDLGRFESKISLQKIEQMIRATKHDVSVGVDADTKALLDIDLSILGKRYHDYDSYRYAVRQEFCNYSRFKFNFGRRRFLRRLLAGPVFQTEEMKAKYEAPARQNIERELKELDSPFALSFLRKFRIEWTDLIPLGFMTAVYATVAFVLESKFGIPYLPVITGLFLLARVLIEAWLRFGYKKELYKVQEGTALRDETFETYLVVPIVFAVCIRIAEYSAVYSALTILVLILFLFWVARVVAEE